MKKSFNDSLVDIFHEYFFKSEKAINLLLKNQKTAGQKLGILINAAFKEFSEKNKKDKK